MKRFAELLDRLVLTPSRNGKLKLMGDYFRSTPDPDRGLALAALTGDLSIPSIKPAMLRALVTERMDEVLFGYSYDYVGDLAETVSLVWPEAEHPEAEDDPRLADVVARCAAPADNRLISRGPAVKLTPQAALALCMCLHELTTNSLKYGALSTPAGRIDVVWAIEPAGEHLTLTWRESGGPPVTAPKTAGFGTRLIDRLLRPELDGEATRSFEPGGLVFTARLGLTGASRFDNDFGGRDAEGL